MRTHAAVKHTLGLAKYSLPALVLVLGLMPFQITGLAYALNGSGTSGSPYQITSCDDFQDIEDDYTAHYILMNNIDCSSYGDSITIGDDVEAFMGTFDGNDHTVTININNTSYPHDVAGLFNYAASATITNLSIEGSISTDVTTGALAGFIEYSTVENVTIDATVTGGDSTGGLGGWTSSVDILDSQVTGDVTGNGWVGGIAGHSDGTSIVDSMYHGDVVASNDGAGGLVGDADTLTITRSGAEGSVTGNDGYVGGLVGSLAGSQTISESYSTSNVDALGRYAGGLVGRMYSTASIEDSYARGDVSGIGDVGGLVGAAEDNTITDTYVSGWADSGNAVGGILATDYGDTQITDSFWDNLGGMNVYNTAGTTKVGAVEKQPTRDMKTYPLYSTHDTLSGPWDFDTVWGMNGVDNDGYPFLLWQGWMSDPPLDADGVGNTEEAAGPNGGDANGDGIADNEQSNVTSQLNPISGKYSSIQTDCAANFNIQIGAESAADRDVAFDYPAGLVDFIGEDCGGPGSSVTVTHYYFGDLDPATAVLRKWSPPNAYTTIDDAALSVVSIGGQRALKVTYQIVDGGPLDQDGAADGNIRDPVGLGIQVIGAPNTGFASQK